MRNYTLIFKNHIKLSSLALIGGLALMSSNCKSDDPEVINEPSITSIVSASGYEGDAVTINGENFNADAASTTVTFGSEAATITGGTTTTIETTVPENLTPGTTVSVSVIVGDFDALEIDFNVLDPMDLVDDMEFSDFDPKVGEIGTEISLTGSNLLGTIEVYINGTLQTTVNIDLDSDGDEITFDIQEKTFSGEVMLKRADEEITHSDLFTRENIVFEESVDFNTTMGGTDLVVLDDGSYYLCHRNGLVKIGADHIPTDTLIDFETTQKPLGIFLADDGTLYMADNKGGVLYLEPNSTTVKTLVTDDDNIPVFGIVNIVGDNNGHLYATGDITNKILKFDLSQTVVKSEVIVNTVDDPTISLVLVGDSLFVGTDNGVFKIHKDSKDATPEYVVPKSAGYYFSNSDICLHPYSGDIIAVDGTTEGGFYKISLSDYSVVSLFDDTPQGLTVDTYGDLYSTDGTSISKIEVK